MRSSSIVCAATIAALGFATTAQAQGNERHWGGGHEHGQHQQAQHQQYQQHWQQHQQWQAPAHQQQWQQRQQWRAPAYQQRAYNNYAPRYGYQQRAYGNNYAPNYWGHRGGGYYVGGYAPAHRYWIRDWRERNLYAPPYGYGWVETDTGDVLLIALATGLIANAILAQ